MYAMKSRPDETYIPQSRPAPTMVEEQDWDLFADIDESPARALQQHVFEQFGQPVPSSVRGDRLPPLVSVAIIVALTVMLWSAIGGAIVALI